MKCGSWGFGLKHFQRKNGEVTMFEILSNENDRNSIKTDIKIMFEIRSKSIKWKCSKFYQNRSNENARNSIKIDQMKMFEIRSKSIEWKCSKFNQMKMFEIRSNENVSKFDQMKMFRTSIKWKCFEIRSNENVRNSINVRYVHLITTQRTQDNTP
jgi:hypothetical protein